MDNTLNPNTGLVNDPNKAVKNLASFVNQQAGRPTDTEAYSDNRFTGADPYNNRGSAETSDLSKSWFQGGNNTIPVWLDKQGINEQQAFGQTTTQKAVNGIAKFGLKVGLYTGTGLANSFVGVLSSIQQGSLRGFYDNELTRWANDADKTLSEALPHLYTKRESESLLGGVSNFVFDSVLGALAFTTSAVFTEIAASAMTGGLGLVGAGGRLGLQASRLASSTLAKASAKKVLSGYRNAARAAKVGNAIGDVGTLTRQVITGAGFEGMIETQHFMDEAVQDYIADYSKSNGRNPSAEEVEQFKNETLAGPANAVFMANLGIVSASNMVVLPKIFGLGPSKNPYRKYVKSEMVDGKRVYTNTLRNLSANRAKAIGASNVAKRAITEGFWEEGNQGIASSTALKYLAAGRSLEGAAETNEMISSLLEATGEQYSTVEGWREMLVGMLVSGIGSPTITNRKLGWTGGIKEAYNEAQNKIPQIDKYLEALETTKLKYQEAIRSTEINSTMAEALQRNDMFDYKNAEFLDFANFVMTRLQTGHYSEVAEDLKNIIEEMDIAEFADKFGYDPNMTTQELETRRSEVVEKFIDRAEKVKKAYEITDGLTANDQTNLGIAITLAGAENLQERYNDLRKSIGKDDASLKQIERELSFYAMLQSGNIEGIDIEYDTDIIDNVLANNVKVTAKKLGIKPEEVTLDQLIENSTADISILYKKLNKLDPSKESISLEEFKEQYIANFLNVKNTQDPLDENKVKEIENDIKKIAHRLQIMRNQYNRFLTPEGQKELESELESITNELVEAADLDQFNKNLAIARTNAIATTGTEGNLANFQEAEFNNIGRIAGVNDFSLKEREAFIDNKTQELNEEKEDDVNVVSDLKEMIRQELANIKIQSLSTLPNDPKQAIRQLQESIKQLEALKNKLSTYKADNKALYDALESSVKQQVDNLLQTNIDIIDKKIELYNDTISALEKVDTDPPEGGEVFTNLNNLLKTTKTEPGIIINAYNRLMQIAKDEGITAQEALYKYIKIEVEEYKGDTSSVVAKNNSNVTIQRGTIIDNKIMSVKVVLDHPASKIEMGGLYNPHRLLIGGQQIDRSKFGQDLAYTIGIMSQLNNTQVEHDVANNYSNIMDIAAKYNEMMDIFDNIESLGTGLHSLEVVGMTDTIFSISSFEKLDNPQSVAEKIKDPGFRYRAVQSINGKDMIIMYTINRGATRETEKIDRIIVGTIKRDITTNTETIEWQDTTAMESADVIAVSEIIDSMGAIPNTYNFFNLVTKTTNTVDGIERYSPLALEDQFSEILDTASFDTKDPLVKEAMNQVLETIENNYSANKGTKLSKDIPISVNLLNTEEVEYLFAMDPDGNNKEGVKMSIIQYPSNGGISIQFSNRDNKTYNINLNVAYIDGKPYLMRGNSNTIYQMMKALNPSSYATWELYNDAVLEGASNNKLTLVPLNESILISEVEKISKPNTYTAYNKAKGITKGEFERIALLVDLYGFNSLNTKDQNTYTKHEEAFKEVTASPLRKATAKLYPNQVNRIELTSLRKSQTLKPGAVNRDFGTLNVVFDRNMYFGISFNKGVTTNKTKPKPNTDPNEPVLNDKEIPALNNKTANSIALLRKKPFAEFNQVIKDAVLDIKLNESKGTVSSIPHDIALVNLIYNAYKAEFDELIGISDPVVQEDENPVYAPLKASIDWLNKATSIFMPIAFINLPIEVKKPIIEKNKPQIIQTIEGVRDLLNNSQLDKSKYKDISSLIDVLSKDDYAQLFDEDGVLNIGFQDLINKLSDLATSIEPDNSSLFKKEQLPAEQLIDYEQAVKELNRMLPQSIGVSDVLAMNMMTKGVVWGAFRNNIIYLNRAVAGVGTEYHEAFHAVFRTLLTDAEISEFYKQAEVRYGKPTKEQLDRIKDTYPQAIGQDLVNLYYEERMADEFMEYGNKKRQKKGWLERLFDRILEFIKSIGTSNDSIDTLFNRIYRGEFKNAQTKYNVFSKNSQVAYKNLVKYTRQAPSGSRIAADLFDVTFTTDQTNIIYDTIMLRLLDSDKSIENVDLIDSINEVIQEMIVDYYMAIPQIEDADYNNLIMEVAAALSNPNNQSLIQIEIANRIAKELDIEEQDNFLAEEESNEQDSGLDEKGDNSDSENFKKDITVKGFDSSSKRIKRYLSMVWVDTNLLAVDKDTIADIIKKDGLTGLKTAANNRFLYQQLIKLFADTSKYNFMAKLNAFKSLDPQLESFYNKWGQDVLKEINEKSADQYSIEELPYLELETLEWSNTFNLIASEFDRAKVSSWDLLYDDNGLARVLHANQRNMAAIMINSWKVNYNNKNIRYDIETREAQKVKFEKAMGQTRRLFFDTFEIEYTKSNNKSVYLYQKALELSKLLYDTYGIALPIQYVQYSLIQGAVNQKPSFVIQPQSPELDMFNAMQDTNIAILNREFIDKLIVSDRKSLSIYENKDRQGNITETAGFGSLLKDVAEASAIFDPTLIPTVYTNMEGKSIYDMIYKNYGVTRTLEFQSQAARKLLYDIFIMDPQDFLENAADFIDDVKAAFPNKFVNDTEVMSWLTSLAYNPMIRNNKYKSSTEKAEWINALFNNDFKLSFTGGMRLSALEETDEGTLVSSRIGKDSNNQGFAYSNATISERVLYLMSLFSSSTQGARSSKTIYNSEGKATTQEFFLMKPFTPADASTIPLIKVPVYIKSGNIGMISDMIRTEYARIQEVNSNIEFLYNTLSERTNPYYLSELSSNYHYIEKNGTFYSSFLDKSGVRKYFSFTRNFVTRRSNVNDITEDVYNSVVKTLPRGLTFMEFSNNPEVTDLAEMLPQQFNNVPLDTIANQVFEDKFSEFINLLVDEKIVKEAKDGTLYTEILPSGYRTENKALDLAELENFFFSDYVNSFGYSTLVYGDAARNAKNPVDFVKRIKRGIGSGVNYGTGKSKMIILQDEIIDNSEKVKGATRTNRADAQSYSHIMWHFSRILRVAKGLDNKDIRNIYSKLHRGIRLSPQENSILYSNKAQHQSNKTLGVGFSTYFKTSIKPIIREEVSYLPNVHRETVNDLYDQVEAIMFNIPYWNRNEELTQRVKELYSEIHSYWKPNPQTISLHNKLNFMESQAVDILAYQSAIKTDSGRIHISDENGVPYFYSVDGENIASPTDIWDQDLAEIVITDGFKKEITDGTQKAQLIYSEQNDIDAQGNPVMIGKRKPSELVDSYRKLQASRVRKGLDQKLAELKVVNTETGEIVDQFGYKNLMGMFINSLEASNSDPHMIAFFRQDLNGNPRYSLNYPAVESKYQAMFLSYLSSNVLKHKSPGNKLTLVSDAGYEFVRDNNGTVIPKGIYNYKAKNTTLLGDPRKIDFYKGNTRLRHAVKMPNGNYYSEIMLSESYLKQYGYTYEDFINGLVPFELLTFHGVRIPTQDKHSMMNFMVVDFIPESFGNSAVVPSEVTALAGSDFDIDALYTRRFDTYKLGRGREGIVKYGNYLNPEISSEDAFNIALNEIALSLKKKKDKLTPYLPSNLMDIVQSNREAYIDERYGDIQPLSLNEANNLLLELEMKLSYNEGNIDINMTPATLDFLEQMEDKYYRGGELKAKSAITGIYSQLDKIKAEKGVENGQKNIGVGALWNTLFQLLHKERVSITTDPEVAPIFSGRYFNIVQNGRRINDTVSTFITASTDDVKEQKSVLWNLNTTTLSYNLLAIGLGIPQGNSLLMFRNDYVYDIIESSLSIPRTIEAELQDKRYIDAKAIDLFDSGIEQRLYDAIIDRQNNGDNVSQDTIDVEYTILLGTLELTRINADTLNANKVLQLIKGLSESFESAEDLEIALKNLNHRFDKNNNLVELPFKKNIATDITKIFNDPFIAEELRAYSTLSRVVAPNYVLSRTEMFKAAVDDVLYNFSNNFSLTIDSRKLLKNKLIAYLVTKGVKNKVPYYNDARFSLSLLVTNIEKNGLGNLSPLQEKVNKIRASGEFDNNIFLQSFLTFNNVSYLNPSDPEAYRTHSLYGNTLHLIEGNTRNIKDQNYLHRLMTDFVQLVISPNREAQELAADLIGYLMVKDGFSFRQGSFIKQIDPEILHSSMSVMKQLETAFMAKDPQAVRDILGMSIEESVDTFLDVFIRQTKNNIHTKSLFQTEINTSEKLAKGKAEKTNNDLDDNSLIVNEEEVKELNDKDRLVTTIKLEGKKTIRVFNPFATKEIAYNNRLIADLLRADRLKRNFSDKSFSNIMYPKYFTYTYLQSTGENTSKIVKIFQELIAVKTPIEVNGKIHTVLVDRNGVIVDFIEDYVSSNVGKVLPNVIGKSITEFTKDKVYSGGYMAGSIAYYTQAEVTNLNKVELFTATPQQMDMLLKPAGSKREKIDISTIDMSNAPIVDSGSTIRSTKNFNKKSAKNVVDFSEDVMETLEDPITPIESENTTLNKVEGNPAQKIALIKTPGWKMLSDGVTEVLFYTAENGKHTTAISIENGKVLPNNVVNKARSTTNILNAITNKLDGLDLYQIEGIPLMDSVDDTVVEIIKRICK